MSGSAGKNFINEQLAKKLIRAHDGNMALLCVWLSVNGNADIEKAAEELCLTRKETEAALEKLERLGISNSPSPNSKATPAELRFLPNAEELPQYTDTDIRRDSENGGQFQAVVDEAMRILGRSLNSSELTKLFGIYDHLALPPEVIFELLNYCAEVTAEKFGPSRRTAFSFIEKEAYYWANHDINTFEAAEDYIRKQKALKDVSGKIKAMFGIKDRMLSETELSYISSWSDMGFDEECIYEAYDRTVVKTNGLSWPYLDKILKTWKEKGLMTIREIREKDARGITSRSGGSKADNFDVEAANNLMKQNKG